MSRLFGNFEGLKPNHLRQLEKLYRRKVGPQFIITPELARDITRISFEIRRQVALLIDRKGYVKYVIIGDNQGIVIPDISEYRIGPGRLRGLRCVHTHLNEKDALSRDDLTDLALLRLDFMGVITVSSQGLPYQIHVGHILPGMRNEEPYEVMAPLFAHQLDIGCIDFILALESELAQQSSTHKAGKAERALLISVSTASRKQAQDSMAELFELARSSNIAVVDQVIQFRKKADPKYLMGSGKLKDLSIVALQKDANLLIFDQELNPSQIRSITDQIELKVIDRTQLILDIFARRAQSREGKLQVELAQLKYMLPRLMYKNTAMSRLTGGIGGRGPGETKLEINRRRVRDRITSLEKDLQSVKKQRKQQKARRTKRELPIISIIGYTNAGKSTLLNTMTQSKVLAESRLFATLDPSSRRLRFPRDVEVIITDTVGFIQDLPKELMVAFQATLEELESADLLLHVIDISNPRFEAQIESVERILVDLHLNHIPRINALNKQDLMDSELVNHWENRLDAIAISATNSHTLFPMIEKMTEMVESILTSASE